MEVRKRFMMEYEGSDETFALIAGYTNGGAAYRITYKEL